MNVVCVCLIGLGKNILFKTGVCKERRETLCIIERYIQYPYQNLEILPAQAPPYYISIAHCRPSQGRASRVWVDAPTRTLAGTAARIRPGNCCGAASEVGLTLRHGSRSQLHHPTFRFKLC